MLQNKYFQIMNEFLKGYFKKIYGSELIKKVGLSQKAISLILIELEQKGLLKSDFSGNRKYYSINFENPLILEYLILFEKFSKISFLEKNQRLIDFFNEISGKIVCIFGSYAKGRNNSDSDLDLLVVGNKNSLIIKKIGKKYGLDVQVFSLDLSDFKKGIKDNLILKECLDNHILISGEELFLQEVLKWKI